MNGEMTEVYDGTKLFYNRETSEKDRAACVIVHGLCEHQGRYDYLAEKMHEAGIGTYRFDHRGHGQSEGECAFVYHYDEMLDDVNYFVGKALSENPFKPVFLLGHSMKMLLRSKSEQENIAASLSGPFASALEKSCRIQGEDIIREAGYMLPQSEPARAFLQELLDSPPSDAFPEEAVEKLLQMFPGTSV